MNIKVSYRATTHPIVFKNCGVCGKLFAKYHASTMCCSIKCEKERNRLYCNARNARIKNDPEMVYKHRRATIEARKQARLDKIRSDLPNIKQALNLGDEALVDYLYNHYTFSPNLQDRRSYE